MALVVEGRAAGDDRVLVGGELLDDLGRAGRRGDDHLRLVAETQAEQRLVEGLGPPPRGELVAPELHVLLAAQPVGLIGGEQIALRAARPFEPAGRGEVARALVPAAAVEDAGFAEHHHVAHVVGGRADQIDDRKGLRPSPDRLGAGAGLAGAASGEDQPDDPVAGRRLLVRARPEGPVVERLHAFERRQLREQPGALAGVHRQHVADPQDRPVRRGRRARLARASAP